MASTGGREEGGKEWRPDPFLMLASRLAHSHFLVLVTFLRNYPNYVFLAGPLDRSFWRLSRREKRDTSLKFIKLSLPLSALFFQPTEGSQTTLHAVLLIWLFSHNGNKIVIVQAETRKENVKKKITQRKWDVKRPFWEHRRLQTRKHNWLNSCLSLPKNTPPPNVGIPGQDFELTFGISSCQKFPPLNWKVSLSILDYAWGALQVSNNQIYYK